MKLAWASDFGYSAMSSAGVGRASVLVTFMSEVFFTVGLLGGVAGKFQMRIALFAEGESGAEAGMDGSRGEVRFGDSFRRVDRCPRGAVRLVLFGLEGLCVFW